MWLSTSNGIRIIGGYFFEALVRVLGKPKLGSKPKACVRLPKGLPKPDFAQKFFACTIFFWALGMRLANKARSKSHEGNSQNEAKTQCLNFAIARCAKFNFDFFSSVFPRKTCLFIARSHCRIKNTPAALFETRHTKKVYTPYPYRVY